MLNFQRRIVRVPIQNTVEILLFFQNLNFYLYMDIKLSRELDTGVVLVIKIDPFYSFKKDGEKISLEDGFYF